MSHNNCGCNEVQAENTLCCPPPTECDCKLFLNSDCINTFTEDLPCSGIVKGQSLTETILQLDAYLCERFTSVENFLKIVNVGTGVGVYKGISNIGEKQLKTLIDSNLINIVAGVDDITISVDETVLNTFIEANQKTYSASNVGTGAQVYKNTTVTGDNSQFNLRKIRSSNSSVTVTEGTDDIDLTVAIATVPDATSSVKGILKLTNDLGGTADLPTTPTALHITGNEPFTGIKSVTNVTNTLSNGISIASTGSSTTSAALQATVTGAATGILVTNNVVSTGNGIYISNNGGGNGQFISNVSTGAGFYCNNQSTGRGIQAGNTGAGVGLYVSNVNTGIGLIMDSGLTGSGLLFAGQNNGVTTSSLTKLGDFTGNTFVKTGGTASQFLKADGSTSLIDGTETKVTAGTNVTITGSGSIATPYIINAISGGIQVTSVSISSPAMNTGYGVPTGITAGHTIIAVTPFLYCNNANNGYNVGDMITAPAPETNDSGGLSDSGIGIRFNASVYDYVSFSVNGRVDINEPHALDGTSGIPIGNPVPLTTLADWAVRLVITYI